METASIRMSDASKIAEVRRLALERARGLGWDETESGKAALLATEIATNLIKHARDGTVNVTAEGIAHSARLQIVAVDQGPGIGDIERAFDDGFSTAGSPGTGLGAIRRLASSLDVFSTPDKGTVLCAEIGTRSETDPAGAFAVGGVCIPQDGEVANGDGWDYFASDDKLAVLLSDGLGHGLLASEASRVAIQAFRVDPLSAVTETMSRLHDALRATRGAAAALALIDRRQGQLRYCGVGNITGAILSGGETRHLVSHNGILGHASPRIAEFVYAWTPASALVLHSDGISARWRPDSWPDLWHRPPALVAGAIYRDWKRGRDDASAVVARLA